VDLEDIAQDYVETVSVLSSVGTIYLDKHTHELTFVGEDIIELERKEYLKVLNYYKQYKRHSTQGGNCVSCNEKRKSYVRNSFEDFVTSLRKKYFGISEV